MLRGGEKHLGEPAPTGSEREDAGAWVLRRAGRGTRVPGQRGPEQMLGSKELARSEGMRPAAPRARPASPNQLLTRKVLGVQGC